METIELHMAPQPQQPAGDTPKSGSHMHIGLIIVFVALALGAAASFYLAFTTQSTPQEQEKPVVSAPTLTPTPVPWKTYVSSDNSFSIEYPSEWQVEEKKGLMTRGDKQYDTQDIFFGLPQIVSSNPSASPSSPLTIEPSFAILIATSPEFETLNLEDFRDHLNAKKIEESGLPVFDLPRWQEATVGGILPARAAYHLSCTSGQCLDVFVKKDNTIYQFSMNKASRDEAALTEFNTIISTFKFLDHSLLPTCTPRPPCLDAEPRCLIPETPDMCAPAPSSVVCTADAKLCPDGSYVARTGPACEFAPCPR